MNKEHGIISPDGVRHLRFPLPRVADAQSIAAAVRHALVAFGSHTFSHEARAAFESALAESLGGLPVEAVAWHDCHSRQLACLGDAWMCHRWLLETRPL